MTYLNEQLNTLKDIIQKLESFIIEVEKLSKKINIINEDLTSNLYSDKKDQFISLADIQQNVNIFHMELLLYVQFVKQLQSMKKVMRVNV